MAALVQPSGLVNQDAHARVVVAVNENAGGVGRGAQERLLAILQKHNVEVTEVVTEVAALDGVLRDAARAANAIIVLGGDGTARAAAEAWSGGPPLILLPGGTLNVLPRALYGELAWPEALEAALERGVTKRLVGGQANGRRFFVAALFGAPTLLARAREAARQGRILAAFQRAQRAFTALNRRRLRACPGGFAVTKAEGVGVLCPAYGGEIDDSSLEWVHLDAAGVADIARLGVRSWLGGWREDSKITIHRCAHGLIRSLGSIPATLDGEPTTFPPRVHIEMIRKGPKVLALD